MKKFIVVAAVAAGLVVVAKRFGPCANGIDWEKRLERMPDNAPPKWMFRNISAIRENTERILGALEGQPARAGEPTAS
jgi:hypothetical protein